MRLGTLVTNPAVRDLTVTSSLFATLNLISGGRMELGIGRGDSSRRVLGKKPVSWSQLETAVKIFRDLTASREIEYEGQPTRLTWAKVSPRVWIAGYGPKVLHMAGRVADGIILQFADPDLISWCLGFVKEGARAAGRDPNEIEVMSAAPVWVSDDLAVARERVRWFPALVSNHVMDLIRQYKPEDLPPALTSYVQDRGGYDYLHHCVVESDNANFVSDEVVDRFCLVGPVKAHHEKTAQAGQRGGYAIQFVSDVRRRGTIARHLSARGSAGVPGNREDETLKLRGWHRRKHSAGAEISSSRNRPRRKRQSRRTTNNHKERARTELPVRSAPFLLPAQARSLRAS